MREKKEATLLKEEREVFLSLSRGVLGREGGREGGVSGRREGEREGGREGRTEREACRRLCCLCRHLGHRLLSEGGREGGRVKMTEG